MTKTDMTGKIHNKIRIHDFRSMYSLVKHKYNIQQLYIYLIHINRLGSVVKIFQYKNL